jgi:cell wall-associated NlpC family hydrolase
MLVAAAGAPLASSQRTDTTLGAKAAQAAIHEIGTPYVWGGTSPSRGFDSSGLVVWAYAEAGRPGLPHYSQALWTSGERVQRASLRLGDLVFFYQRAHVGVYIGNGRFVHAPHTGAVVSTASLSHGLYASNYSGAVRITR